MGDYRRMGSVVQHIGNATSTTLMHKLRGLWMNPRGTVLRIEALALVAIAISFFLATCGSCRRWSNSWILQKGFLAANALFLSLGTYSIGLMQSSPVKSEMYPIWAVSLFALLCCIDSVTMFSFDNKSQVWKMLYQLFLYCGYVLLMSISSISSDIGNIAICVLSAITLLKGFHKSMALLLPGRMRNVIRDTQDSELFIVGLRYFTREKKLMVHLPLDEDNAAKVAKTDVAIKVHAINSMYKGGELRSDIRDVCLSLSLSHMLQLRLLGVKEDDESMIFDKSVPFNWFELKGDHDGVTEWAFKVVEVELAFLYDILFTSNAFLHYYEAKTASIWVLASLVGICFVGVVAAMPGTRTVRWASSSSSSGGHGTAVVGTTTADLVITGVILVSLALLQVVQLLRCWTSNWARVAFACDCARQRRKQEEEAEVKHKRRRQEEEEAEVKQQQRRKQEEEAEVKQQQQQGGDSVQGIHLKRGWCLRLRAHLLRINWFESYLWQDKLGQHSMVEPTGGCLQCFTRPAEESACASASRKYCSIVSGMLGLRCVGRELREALCGSGTGDTTIELHSDIKASVAGFLSEVRSDDASAWPSPTVGDERRRIEQISKRSDNESARLGSKYNPALRKTRSRVYDPRLESAARRKLSVAEKYTSSVLTWHVATCYCELAQRHDDDDKGCSTGAERAAVEKDHRVATALSKYCAYLVASVPELLPGPPVDTKKVYDAIARRAREVWRGGGSGGDKLLAAMDKMDTRDHLQELRVMLDERLWMDRPFDDGVQLGQELRRKPPSECWKELAGFWVKALVYAAPSENAEEHMQRLAQGGEFITHVWALLSHAGIRRWQGGLEEPAVAPRTGAGAGAAHGASSSYRPRHGLRRSASVS